VLITDDVAMSPPTFNVGDIADIGSVGEHDVFFRSESQNLAFGESVEIGGMTDHPREHRAEIAGIR